MNTNIENFVNNIKNKADEIFGIKSDTFSQIEQFKWGFKNIVSALDEFEIGYSDENGNVTFKSVMNAVKNNTSITSTDIFKPYIYSKDIDSSIEGAPTIESNGTYTATVFDLSYFFADGARKSYYTAFLNLLKNPYSYISNNSNYPIFFMPYTFYNGDKILDGLNIVLNGDICLESTFLFNKNSKITIDANNIFIYDPRVFESSFIENLSIDCNNIKIFCDEIFITSRNLSRESIQNLLDKISDNAMDKVVRFYLPIQNNNINIYGFDINKDKCKLIYGGEEIT